jgi:hypothetical protein
VPALAAGRGSSSSSSNDDDDDPSATRHAKAQEFAKGEPVYILISARARETASKNNKGCQMGTFLRLGELFLVDGHHDNLMSS